MATTKRGKGSTGRPIIGSSHSGRTVRGVRKGAAEGEEDGASRPGIGRRPSKGIARGSGAKGPPPTAKRPKAVTKGTARPATRPVTKAKGALVARPTRPRPVAHVDAHAAPRAPGFGGRRMEVRAESSEESRAVAIAVASAALDKKAVNVQIVDVVGRVDYADFLVLMSGRSDRHVLSIADGIEEHLAKIASLGRKLRPSSVEGRELGSWVVLDFGDVIAHVFQEEARAFYDLDALWQDARRVPVANA